MRKIFLTTTISIFIILIICIFYLSIFGIKTNNLNSFINSKVKQYNPKLKFEINDVFIKLNLTKASININIKDPNLFAENNSIKLSNLDFNLDLIKFIQKENSIKNINIKSASNSIKRVASFLNTIDYNLSRYIFYSQIQEGLIDFELNTQHDKINQDLYSYKISGSVKDAKLNLIGHGNFDEINFKFDAQEKQININNLNFNYQKINFLSKNIKIIPKSGKYLIDGNIENLKTSINPNSLFKLANIKQDYLSSKNILLESKNFFSFELNQNNKIKNIKINSIVKFDEIYFSKNYEDIIFLKDGNINSIYENDKFTAEIKSNFAFISDLKSKNEYRNNNLKLSLQGKNDQKITVKGNISNKKIPINPKFFINFFQFDANLLSEKNINIETDTKFQFELNNNKVKNYLVNSTINIDKLEFNKKIQDTLYLKNINTKLIFAENSLKLDLKSNYSFLNNKYNNKLDNNILNVKFDKTNSRISDIEIFLNTDNNKINTREFKKYLSLKDDIVDDQIIDLDSNFKINISVDQKFNIKKFAIKSDLNVDNLYINYKSNFIKKYLENYEDKLTIKNSNILIEYSDDLINLQLNGKYFLQNQEDDFFIKFKGNLNNFELYSLFDLDNSVLNLSEIQYIKKKNIPSKLEILLNHSEKESNFQNIIFTENKNNISVRNLKISEDFKITRLDEIDVNFLNMNKVLNKFKLERNFDNYNFTGHQIDGEKILENLLKNKNKNKISKLFDKINTSIKFNINKIYLEKNEYLNSFVGSADIKNNKLFLSNINAVLNNENKFSYSFRTTEKKKQITNILIEEPKPFINNYKFIKGFEKGRLNLNSQKIGNISRSNLKIKNFKVKEVPVLAKILTLASLQGIADLLTGEGIRFDEFEMDFKTKSNLTEIDEMYALGPAISIMMEGYIEKDRTTSLRGTLVPATTINKTIAKIPLLGNILVGSKTGEGVFGVSFKIKGPPDDLKSTVNPIKTLTPRFITRTLENLKGN